MYIRTIKAYYKNGIIKPLEKLNLKDGKEITITILESPKRKSKSNFLDKTFAGWKGLLNAEQFKKNIYRSRLIITRPEVKL